MMDNNQFVARTATQYAFATGDIASAAITSIFVSDNNYFARPFDAASVDDVHFEYNASNSTRVVDLGAEYVAIDGTSYTTLELAPYRPVVRAVVDPLQRSPSPTAT